MTVWKVELVNLGLDVVNPFPWETSELNTFDLSVNVTSVTNNGIALHPPHGFYNDDPGVACRCIEDVNPALQWILAVIGGGGIAGTIQIGSALTRAASTTTTGGVANPVVSTAEAGGAVACSALAVIVPVVAVVLVLVLMTFVVRLLIKKKRAVPES